MLLVALFRSSVAALYCLCFRSVLLVGKRGGALRSNQPKGWKTTRPAGHTAKEKSNERGDRGNTGWFMGFLAVMGRTALRLSHLIAYKLLAPRSISTAGCLYIATGASDRASSSPDFPVAFCTPGLYRNIGVISVLDRYCIASGLVLDRFWIGFQ